VVDTHPHPKRLWNDSSFSKKGRTEEENVSFDYRQIHQLLHNDDEGHFMQSDGFFTSLQMLGGYFRRSFFHPFFVDMAITSLKNCITTKVRHLSFHPILFWYKTLREYFLSKSFLSQAAQRFPALQVFWVCRLSKYSIANQPLYLHKYC
jgi:hypothetical protein